MGIIYKTCISCRERKVRGLFDKHKTYLDGFHVKCKRCSRVKDGSRRYRDTKFAQQQKMRWGHARI